MLDGALLAAFRVLGQQLLVVKVDAELLSQLLLAWTLQRTALVLGHVSVLDQRYGFLVALEGDRSLMMATLGVLAASFACLAGLLRIRWRGYSLA